MPNKLLFAKIFHRPWQNNLPAIVFFTGIFFLPFAYWPFSQIPFEVPRVWFMLFWIELLIVASVITLQPLNKKADIFLLVLAALFTSLITFSGVQGVALQKSFWGNPYRMDGLLTYYHLFFLFLLLAFLWKDNWKQGLSWALAGGSTLLSTLAVIQGMANHFIKGISPYFDGSVGLTFGNPNFLAGFLVVTLPFVAFNIVYSQKIGKKLWKAALLLQITAIEFSLSAGGILGVGLFLLLWFLFFGKNLLLKSGFALILLFAFCVSLLAIYKNQPTYIPNHDNIQVHPEGRFRIFTQALQAIKERPLTGWGWANFDLAFEATNKFNWGNDVYVDKTHSMLLEIASTAGIPALAIYLLIIFYLSIKLIRQSNLWQKTLLITLLLYFFHSQTNVISINEEIFLWLILGITASKNT